MATAFSDALVVGNQVLLIFIYVIMGIICEKTGILSKEGGGTLSKLSLIIVTPAVIIDSFQREFEQDLLLNLAIVFVLAIITHLVSTSIALFFVKKRGGDNRYRIERYGVAFANSGYMAIPLVGAVLGGVGVFYLSVFIGVFNLFTWTVGISILDPTNKINLKKAIVNPGVIGLSIGLILYLLQIKIPGALNSAVSGLASMNTPLSMMTAGIFLADINIKQVVTNARLYYTSFLKLIVVPSVMIGILWLTRVSVWAADGSNIAMVILLACACPTAGATVQFSTQYSPEHSEYGAELVAMTTLLSIVTLPIMSYLVDFLV